MRFLMAACLLALGHTTELVACSCPPASPPKKALEFAKAVFLAEVTGVETAAEDRTVTLTVERWWKGGDTAEVTVATQKSGAACGYGFEKGKKYLVYAKWEEGQKKLHVSLCSRTRTEREAERDGDFKELGEGKKPDRPREALALKAEMDGDTAKVTVAFNYTGKPGDPATFQGVRLYKYDMPVGKGPTAVGWHGKEGRQAVVLGGTKYTFYPALMDRQENGSLSVTKAGEKVRITGVYHAYENLFVIDETVKPGDPVLLEQAVAVDLRDADGKVLVAADEITGYDWATHTIEMQPGSFAKLRKAYSDGKKLAVPFSVSVGGMTAYRGEMTSIGSSQSCPGVVILLGGPGLKKDTVVLQLGYPAESAFEGKDPRGDESVKAALKAAGKLK